MGQLDSRHPLSPFGIRAQGAKPPPAADRGFTPEGSLTYIASLFFPLDIRVQGLRPSRADRPFTPWNFLLFMADPRVFLNVENLRVAHCK